VLGGLFVIREIETPSRLTVVPAKKLYSLGSVLVLSRTGLELDYISIVVSYHNQTEKNT